MSLPYTPTEWMPHVAVFSTLGYSAIRANDNQSKCHRRMEKTVWISEQNEILSTRFEYLQWLIFTSTKKILFLHPHISRNWLWFYWIDIYKNCLKTYFDWFRYLYKISISKLPPFHDNIWLKVFKDCETQ